MREHIALESPQTLGDVAQVVVAVESLNRIEEQIRAIVIAHPQESALLLPEWEKVWLEYHEACLDHIMIDENEMFENDE